MIKDPENTDNRLFYQLLSSVITPRPIALVSSCDIKGQVNLAPFSFFNMVSVNPPILVFSPLRRMRTNTTKDTLNNAKSQKEVVINIVGFEHVEQMSLAGGEYDNSINEFDKTGFTTIESIKIVPPRVKEAIASFECKVIDILEFGKEGGAGNLVVCEIMLAHFKDEIFNAASQIDPHLFNPIGRLGKSYYIKGDEQSIFEIEKRNEGSGIGWDAIPDFIKKSKELSGNEIAKLASVQTIPIPIRTDGNKLKESEKIQQVKQLLSKEHIIEAWEVILR